MAIRTASFMLAALLGGAAFAGSPSFVSIQPLAGDYAVETVGVSADARSVLLKSTGLVGGLGKRQLAVWSEGIGAFVPSGVPLRTVNQHVDGVAISANGSFIAGRVTTATSTGGFRWGQAAAYQPLTFDPRAISADGSVVVGRTLDNDLEAVVWHPLTGAYTLINPLGTIANANAVSANGVVVGSVNSGTGPTTTRAFRWTSAAGMIDIGRLPGAASAAARGVSGDGSVVVGESGSAVFRWTAAGGMTQIATGTVTNYVRVTPDGGTILANVDVPGPIEGMIWDQVWGRRDLSTILPFLPGFDAGAWASLTPVDMSADGSVIVGTGRDLQGNTRAWIATVPSPSALLVVGGGWVLGMRRRRAALAACR